MKGRRAMQDGRAETGRATPTEHSAMATVALLLLGSGFCALVYQIAWLRLLRLVFGTSTAATAAVLALFMGGLGAGSLLLGRRADAATRPLRLYARLEAGIALAAALSPALVAVVHTLYVSLGGSLALGDGLATAVRLLLTALVLGPATVLMGGSLPAAARAVIGAGDRNRSGVAWLYAMSSLGAVAGSLFSTFVSIEWLGIRTTLLSAAGLNLVIAAVAWWRGGKRHTQPADRGLLHGAAGDVPATASRRFVGTAAAIVGFVFLVLELVWYRMLSPLLGGSSYTFGLILAIALLGIAAGGLVYAALAPRLGAGRGGAGLLALTCAVESVAVLLPFALGDRIAVWTMLMRPLGDLDFALLAASWALIAGIVVLPAAIIAGFQFPLLVAMLGSGDRDLGRDVGSAFAWNTAGAIAGAIAGAFLLIPRLGAVTTWRAMALLLLGLAAVAAVIAWRRGRAPVRLAWPAAAAAVALALASAAGPSAVWRHTPIGAGGMPSTFDGPNDLRDLMQTVRRAIVWQADGRESTVAIHALDEISFLIGGKADGSAVKDAPTQVMGGLIGAALHPEPRSALVIGLGTGSSAGWLAEVASIERVDVYELEPAVLEVARRCAPVNRDVLSKDNVEVIIGDGRELLATTDAVYDLVFSEPSNPYRAGVASLFTGEFYAAARAHLADDGIFLQWLQAYEVDAQVARTVIATLRSVFGSVETWQTHTNDLLLVASRRRIDHDLVRIASRLAEPPFRTAMAQVLGVEGTAGLYAGFVAGPSLATAVLEAEAGRINTDDRPIIEFGFARGLGRDLELSVGRLARLAVNRGESLPMVRRGRLEPLTLAEARSARNAQWGNTTEFPPSGDPGFDFRVAARNAWVRGELEGAAAQWHRQAAEPSAPIDRVIVAEALAAAGEPRAAELADSLEAAGDRFTALAVRGRLAAGQAPERATEALAAAFEQARTDPWLRRPLLERSLHLAADLAEAHPEHSEPLFRALGAPFAVSLLDDLRLETRLRIAQTADFETRCQEAFEPFEPHVPWREAFLTLRLRCYQATGASRADIAARDFEAFLVAAPPRLAPGA